jgi:hypothetical protein
LMTFGRLPQSLGYHLLSMTLSLQQALGVSSSRYTPACLPTYLLPKLCPPPSICYLGQHG